MNDVRKGACANHLSTVANFLKVCSSSLLSLQICGPWVREWPWGPCPAHTALWVAQRCLQAGLGLRSAAPVLRTPSTVTTQTFCSQNQLWRLQRRKKSPSYPHQMFAFPVLGYLNMAGDLFYSPEPFSFPWELWERRWDLSRQRAGFSGSQSHPLTPVLPFSLLRGLMSPSTLALRRTWSLNSSWRRWPRPLGLTTASTRRTASSRTRALKLLW